MGATPDQVTEAVGYGPKFPVCEANDTPDCKARNRRVACKWTKTSWLMVI